MTKRQIRSFIKSISNLHTTFKKEGFYYSHKKKTVNIDLTDSEDMGFMRHLSKVHKCSFANEYPVLLWSILHEVGHYFTFDEDTLDDETDERIVLSAIDNKKLMRSVAIQNRYFNLESEWLATEWAINFVANNRQELKNWR